MIHPTIDHWTVYDSLIEDIERLRLKLGVEIAMQEKDSDVAKRLNFILLEADDALEKLRRMGDRRPMQS
jgi:hypothetical protein